MPSNCAQRFFPWGEETAEVQLGGQLKQGRKTLCKPEFLAPLGGGTRRK
jgi:hypothetical protein